MTVTADTIRLISLGEYTVGESGTITESDFASYLQYAQDQFSTDSPGNHTSSQADQAIALLICHYIDRANNDQSIKSEDAGDGSTSFDGSGSNWMKSYKEIVNSLLTKYKRDLENPSGSYRQPTKAAHRRDGGFSGVGAPASSWGRWR